MFRSLRFSIAGLMGAVLVAAIGLAALRDPSELWAGVIFLLTCGVLMLAVVGVVCRGEARRAWWLGFALFGWGYLVLAFFLALNGVLPALPTTPLIRRVLPNIVAPGGMMGGGMRSVDLLPQFGGMGCVVGGAFTGMEEWRISHSLLALLAAVLGGTLARLVFGTAPAEREGPIAGPESAAPPDKKGWRRWALIGLAGLALFAGVALADLRSVPGFLAGGTFFLTWAVIGVAVLAAVHGRGRRRAAGLGAALFGAGALILIFGPRSNEDLAPRNVTNLLLNDVRAWLPPGVAEYPASSTRVAVANARIRKALEQPVPMYFPGETPLEEVLKWIQAQAVGLEGRSLLPIYVDPVGLNEAEKTMTSPVSINLDGVPLKTSLELALKQLGLTYRITEGVLLIDSIASGEAMPVHDDPFLIVGNCFLALIAAGLGGLLGPVVAGRSSA
jgi:hypothetical protein